MKHSAYIKVWDPLVRIFHWALVFCFLLAFITEDELPGVHAWAGYGVLLLLAIRVAWGFVGPRYARFSNFVYSPAHIAGYLKDTLMLRARRYIGHNPLGGAMILALLASLTLSGLSGMALYGATEFAGPLAGAMAGMSDSGAHMLEEVHEFFAYLTLTLVVVHVGGVLFESLVHRENLVRAMLNGLKRDNPAQSS
jgi:cytochrome b